MRFLYSALNRRRRALGGTSGSGRTLSDGDDAVVAPTLFLFFDKGSHLSALYTNCGGKRCLIIIGRKGWAHRGLTPDEVHYGKGEGVRERLAEGRREAREKRLETNRAGNCGVCAPTKRAA